MPHPLILITDCGFPHAEEEKHVAQAANVDLRVLDCHSPEEVIAHAAAATVLINQHVQITADVIRALPHCRAIVRYGIGVDNVDVEAATSAGIAVCNVPDYGVEEVAEHALALALALARQLPQTAQRLHRHEWSYVAPGPVTGFSEMTLGTAGFGRIARMLHQKAAALGFRQIAFDPFLPASAFADTGVTQVDAETLLAESHILSLHLPLTKDTHHWLNADSLRKLPPRAILINTARGALIDTVALAEALNAGRLAGAGLDVFEQEPPPHDHPIFQAPNTILTSHTAWYSTGSILRLQRLAAEEAVRAALGQPLRCPVNQPNPPKP